MGLPFIVIIHDDARKNLHDQEYVLASLVSRLASWNVGNPPHIFKRLSSLSEYSSYPPQSPHSLSAQTVRD